MRYTFFFASLFLAPLCFAGPLNPEALQGSFEIDHIDSKLCRITVSEAAFIYWDDFSIGENECVEILQPSSESIVVMEVVKSSPSALLGTLKANGSVFLTNPHGVFIGEDGFVEASGFLASALPGCPCPLIDKDYDVFIQGGSKAKVINEGRIKASNGDVYLIGHQVRNQGAVDAPQGVVSMAAGDNIVLNRSNGQKIGVIPSPVKEENEETGVENAGMIVAEKVELKADGNAYGNAILHSGLISVGEAYLVAEKGNCIVHGAIQAEKVDGTGGEIHILGENIFLFRSSLLDASGEKGGGTISVGKGSDGEGEDPIIAQMTFVDEGVSIFADALESGNGGVIKIWSNEEMYFRGETSAKPGGSVEINGPMETEGP